MTLAPLLTAPPIIQLHVIAVILALILGPLAMLRRSRDIWHKLLGRGWVLAMAVTALSSFLITDIRLIGRFSPIHILSVLTLFSLWQGVAHARAGRIGLHRQTMLSLYTYAIGIAGVFTMLPGRRMSDVLFGAAPWTGFFGMAILLLAVIIWQRHRATPAQ